MSSASDHSFWKVGSFWFITIGLMSILSFGGILPRSVALVSDSAWLLALSMVSVSRKKIFFNESSSCCSRLRVVFVVVLMALEPVFLVSVGGPMYWVNICSGSLSWRERRLPMLTSTVAVFWKRWVSSLRRGVSGTVELSLSFSTTASNSAIVFSFLVFVLLCVTVFGWLFL